MITIYCVWIDKTALFTQDYKEAVNTFYEWAEKYDKVALYKEVFHSQKDCEEDNMLYEEKLLSYDNKLRY